MISPCQSFHFRTRCFIVCWEVVSVACLHLRDATITQPCLCRCWIGSSRSNQNWFGVAYSFGGLTPTSSTAYSYPHLSQATTDWKDSNCYWEVGLRYYSRLQVVSYDSKCTSLHLNSSTHCAVSNLKYQCYCCWYCYRSPIPTIEVMRTATASCSKHQCSYSTLCLLSKCFLVLQSDHWHWLPTAPLFKTLASCSASLVACVSR